LSQLWWKGNANWEAYVDSVVADPSIYGTHADAFRQLNYAANHNLFTGAFDTLLMGFSRLVAAAEKELQIALTQRNTHPPHYALFLAFLRLYRAAQDEMNKLGRKHLDFYYKDILQLKTRPSQPNFVHIVTSLSKTTENLILAKDVLYKAGKDSIGKDVSYGLDEETTFNKATVADMRAVYIGEAGDDDLGSKNNGRVFAAPVINSADGLGSGLKSSGKEWHPMANRLYIEGDVASVEMPFAEIGFAVASHYFLMAEGERSIRLRFETSDNQLISGKAFRVFLTTEKDWYEVPEDIYPAEGEFRQGGVACIEFNISLTGDAPSVTDYNPEVHKGNLEVQVPVLKVLLKHDVDAYYDYGVLRDVSVKKMEILVSAGGLSSYNQNGLKNLILSADSGPIDGSKAFQPFGPSPVAGNRLVIGSKELLSKKNVTIGFNIEYKDINSYSSTSIAYGTQPDGGNLPNMAIKFLKRGKWEIWESKRELFSTSINETILIKPSSKLDDLVVVDYNDPDYNFGPHAKNGFICFELLENFGHKAYQQALTEYLIDQSKESPKLSKPEEPYTPVIKSLYVSYEAHSEVIDLGSEIKSLFQAKSFSFIHLYPFGSLEQHTLVTGEQVHYFLPQFRQYDEVLGADRKHQGEFYIGFAGLKPQSAVQVLFQVMDGTADPTLTIPDDHVRWSYLSGNAWVDFSKQDIIDRTRQLIQSGTIRFSIPEVRLMAFVN
nr:hypothetical protein [Chitinophagaceae bacterium]